MKIILSAFLFLVTGCAPRYLLYSVEKFPGLQINGTIKSIRIEDKRGEQQKIHVAFLNPNHPSIFKSPLDSIDSSVIFAQAKRNWTGIGKNASIIIKVDEAQVGYQVFFWHADEFTKVKVTTQVLLEQGEVGECSGNAELQRKSQKASEKTMKRMFDETLELGVYKCLEAIKTQIDQRTAWPKT
ncbi:MAG: hypothetical protein JF616_10560 [Fibrobacteres bacterium]|jgi:hypothetical protein|nr:hypothetical protein [Fibrobacterota bacterium]